MRKTSLTNTVDAHGDVMLIATPEFMSMSAAAQVAEIERLCGDAEEIAGLSVGERQVVFAGMAGMRSSEIAKFTGRAATTVDVIRGRALKKTGSTTLAHLVTKLLGRNR